MSRCVICGRPKDQHVGEQLKCLGSAGESGKCYASMDLPTGMTCDDCGHFRFCLQFLGPEISGNTECDWYPIRFVSQISERVEA